MPPPEQDKRQAAREVIDILHEIATLLVLLLFYIDTATAAIG